MYQQSVIPSTIHATLTHVLKATSVLSTTNANLKSMLAHLIAVSRGVLWEINQVLLCQREAGSACP